MNKQLEDYLKNESRETQNKLDVLVEKNSLLWLIENRLKMNETNDFVKMIQHTIEFFYIKEKENNKDYTELIDSLKTIQHLFEANYE